MSGDIIKSNVLTGKTEEEIDELLGDDFYRCGDFGGLPARCYTLGFLPGMIDPDVLKIEFKDGVVIKIEQYTS